MHLKNWTKQEDEQLRALAGKMSSVEIAAIMSRSSLSVRKRCSKLGISLSGGHESAKPWTDEDLDRLALYRARGYSHKKIGELLGRSESSVTGRILRNSMRREESVGDIDRTMWGNISIMSLRVPMNEIARNIKDDNGGFDV